ncbi:MAG: cation:proton antiporter subunit C [Planctomycetota bacterium]
MERFGIYNYWIHVILMMIGFYAVIARTNLIKKLLGLGLFQTAIFLFYISMAMVEGGVAPIKGGNGEAPFVNPIPHVLILTAIVVALSTMAVALAIVINIQRAYGTIEADELDIENEDEEEDPR